MIDHGNKRKNDRTLFEYTNGFKNDKKRPIMLHKPYPGNIVKNYALKQVYEDLKEAGYVK